MPSCLQNQECGLLADELTGEAKHSLAWLALAIAIFAFANGMLFHQVIGQDLSQVVLANVDRDAIGEFSQSRWESLGRTDLRFGTWLTARNADALSTRPHRLFDAEICYPTRNALAYGEPGVALGFLAIPFWIASGDPLITFNAVLISIGMIAALAMFLLIRELTGSPQAAIVAGLFYAFHHAKTHDVIHPFIWDNAWTVLAFYFALRLFRGRGSGWFPALGLALVACLQIAGSIYPGVAEHQGCSDYQGRRGCYAS